MMRVSALTSFSIRMLLVTFSGVVMLCLLVSYVHAETTVWNKTYVERICGPADSAFYVDGGKKGSKFCKWFKADNPNVSIHYGVSVVNQDTGAIVPSGSSVPLGTRLQYAFKSHERTDITWFLTGFSADSPYGEWNAGAPELGCFENDLIHGKYFGGDSSYASFAVTPPVKSITGLDGASCTTSGVNKNCTVGTAGTYTAAFTFAPTDGRFYGRGVTKKKKCFGSNVPAQTKDQQTFLVSVPQQTIPHTVIVSDEPVDPTHAPTSPTLSAGVCVVGEPHTISFTSTDPDNDNLRYGIDWNDDGAVDQWVPPTGYVASGSTQSASRTYTTTGQKTVNVLAEDEGGIISNWTATSFSCAPDSVTAGLNEGGTGGAGDGGDGTFLPTTPDLNLRAIPSLVRQGATTQVNWSATNVESCTVTGTNGDSWSGIESAIGGETSSAIQGQTTYTLTCVDDAGASFSDQAIVNVIPGFQEI